MNENEFEKDLEIDPDQLDVEAGMQGELFFKWAMKATRAREAVRQADLNLKVTKSEIGNKIRKNPSKYGIDKITETGIHNAVRLTPKYKEVNEEYIEALYESELLDSAVKAMEQRKRMIEVLITLHGQQYFAGPSVPRNLVEAWKEERKKRNREVQKKTKLRKRS